MEITLNNNPYKLPEDQEYTVLALVKDKFPDSQKGVAVAIENEVLPREEWINRTLNANDKVHIFRAIQGG
ncbi:sulfur carrier protein ThiS [Pleomorphovibrio marinus]|uniref:sulfur carrier protein ThiS n=1 Tax=Pleomorphovibrio marinus TaxID=2164132 RepID=UPI000E0AC363|nr:sulfur carrier protein ThiS [Pleomorphovibrio marinus]